MSYAAKLRWMLALLTATLLLTAIIARKTYTPQNSLNQSAKVLEDNLHRKESLVYQKINTEEAFGKLKTLTTDGQYALDFIKEMTTDNRIWVVTFNNNTLSFWSGIKVIPSITVIRNGASFIKTANGYYEVIKKTEGNFSALFFILIKADYAFQNQYLKNAFEPQLFNDNNIEIADFTDKNVYEIYNINHTYLFSVKIKPNQINHRFFYFETLFWILTFITLCILIHNISSYFARKGYTWVSIIFLTVFIVGIRFINLYFHWPDFTTRLDIFNPQIYKSNEVYPTLGDFCINTLLLSWFASFLFKQRNRLLRKDPGKIVSYILLLACILILITSLTVLLYTFYGLVSNSQINFDVNNLLNLSYYSALGILMLCFSFLIFFLFTETCLTISKRLSIPLSNQLIIFLAGIFLTTVIVAWWQEFTLFYIFWAIIVIIRGYSYRYYNRKLTSGLFAVIILLYAFISSVMINHFESLKEKEVRKKLVYKLVVPDDPIAYKLFKNIEGKLKSDPLITRAFADTAHNNVEFLKNYIQKLYFDAYLSKYDFKLHEFNDNGQAIGPDKTYALADFKDMVLFSSLKVSNYFYHENSSFGFQNYFALLPVINNNRSLGVLVIELRSKSVQVAQAFPKLLVDGNINQDDEFKNYSYAFYSDNRLISQHGSFVYNLKNTDFKGVLKKSVFTTTNVSNPVWYRPFAQYSHLVYKSSGRNLIIISKQENIVLYDLASLTFFFVVMLIFSVIVIIIRWSWIRIKILSVTDNRVKWTFKIKFDRLLYKTRIQFSMVFAVVITLIIVALITYISISTQYQSQLDKTIRDKINRIASSFGDEMGNKSMTQLNENDQISFNRIANSYGTDLSLFDGNGQLLITTQPKIYETGLLVKRMNASAYISLGKQQLSEFINDEKIGDLSYRAAYSPLRKSNGQAIAYLQLPYFSNEADYQDRIVSLLNIMFNVYALVFIAIGLLAVGIARQITSPLNFIQSNLSRIIYGKKNEPIQWERDDEIGALVKEYNRMILELEESAQKLAQSERESAWREMAKQVAHEIKNPLTPLKLGLQLLDKSWKEKDPKFDQKFERFSKSFVEQIESLSSIASEFSAFAKMPDTRLERINIFDMLSQAVTIFKQMDNFTINFNAAADPFFILADRDQLLRCFNNLLKNAIEATPEDRPGVIDIAYTISEKNILLTLKDNGNGIPENMREKIFEPNFTTKSSGTGLGLAFVKNSIENARGKVWFETTLGVGTTFYLSLPAADVNA
ncbi:MAG: ATP-binding protein [Mucilaginibacter sp.]